MEKTPITDEEYQKLSEVEKDVYDLFFEFYNPKEIPKIRFIEKRDDINNFDKYVKFYVLDTKIKYGILVSNNYDSLLKTDNEIINNKDTSFHYNPFVDKTEKEDPNIYVSYLEDCLFDNFVLSDSIINFRPKIKDATTKILYYQMNYDLIISNFIEYDEKELASYEPVTIIRTSKIKTRFLKKYIHTIENQCYERSFIITVPIISKIVFTNNLDYAKISYETPNYFNFAYYKKVEGKWKFVRDRHNFNL